MDQVIERLRASEDAKKLKGSGRPRLGETIRKVCDLKADG